VICARDDHAAGTRQRTLRAGSANENRLRMRSSRDRLTG
jgi:hypothetical protein